MKSDNGDPGTPSGPSYVPDDDPTLFPLTGPVAAGLGLTDISDVPTTQIHEELPKQLGDFLRGDLIGEGGMGAVYSGTQLAPVKRDVAIKVIKRSINTEEARVRMKIEWMSLARFEHPNIARFINCGFCGRGRIPFMVMELAKGPNIVDYCNARTKELKQPLTAASGKKKARGLLLHERLRLFLEVCDALSHAHRKQVLHRDISANNVRVVEQDGKATVKLIDFGISILLDHEQATDRQIAGTAAYMSPEQIEAAMMARDRTSPAGTPSRIDEKSDIYSLGVLLFELLTGMRPYPAKTELDAHKYLDEARRTGRTVTPSVTVLKRIELESPADEDTASALRKLGRQLRGDLDAIVAKALKLLPDERYKTVDDLAEDIRLFLANRPLRLAAPSSRVTKVVRFVMRNRVASAAAVAAFLLLVSILVIKMNSNAELKQRNATIERKNLTLEGQEKQLTQNLNVLRASHAESYAATFRSLPDFLENGEFGPVKQALRQTFTGGGERPPPNWEWNHYRERIDASNLTVGTSRSGFLHVLNTGGGICGVAVDGSVWFWDSNGRFLASDRPHRRLVLSAAFSKGWVYTYDEGGLLVWWKAETGSVRGRAVVAKDWMADGAIASLSPDGRHLLLRRLVEGNWKLGFITLPEEPPQAELAKVPLEHAKLEDVPLAMPPAQMLISWNKGNPTGLFKGKNASNVWLTEWRIDGEKMNPVRTVKSLPFVMPESFQCSGDRMLFQYEVGAFLFSLELKEAEWVSSEDPVPLPGNGRWLNVASFSPNGTLVATGGTDQDRSIRLWDAQSGKFKGVLNGRHGDLGTLLGHEGAITSFAFDGSLSSECTVILSASMDGTIRRWKNCAPLYGRAMQPAVEEGEDPGKPYFSYVRFIRSGNRYEMLGAFSDSPWLAKWDTETGERIATPPMKDGRPLFVDARGKLAGAAASENGKVIALRRRFRVAEGVHDELVVGDFLTSDAMPTPLPNLSQSVETFVVSNNGKWLAISTGEEPAPGAQSQKPKVLLWRIDNGVPAEKFLELEGVTSLAGCLAFSKDGGMLAAGSENGDILVWPVNEKPGLPKKFKSPDGCAVNSMAFNVDLGKPQKLALGLRKEVEMGGTLAHGLALCDPATGTISTHRAASGQSDLMAAICWNPSDTRIATAENDRTVRVWALDSDTWRLVLTLRDFRGYVDTISWSPCSQFLAAASPYQGAVLYRAHAGEKEDARFLLHEFQREQLQQPELTARWNSAPETLSVRNYLTGLLESFKQDPMVVNEWALSELSLPEDPFKSEAQKDRRKVVRTEVETVAKRWVSEPALQKTLGLAHYRCGAFKEAVTTLEQLQASASEFKQDLQTEVVLAMALQRSGQEAEASKSWEKVQAIEKVKVQFSASAAPAAPNLLAELMVEARRIFANVNE